MKYRIGAQTIVWGESIRENYRSILTFLKQEGYQGVETGMRHFDSETPRLYHKMFQEHKILPLAIHIGGKFWDPAQSLEEIGRIDKAIDFAQQVGFRYLVISGNPRETAESMREAASIYEALGIKCLERGITFAYHNHYWELKEDFCILKELVEGTSPEAVSFVLDVAWAYHAGVDLEQLFSLLNRRIAYLHIKDVKGDTFCELGTGELDFQRVLRLADTQSIPWIVVEQDVTTLRPEESMKKNMTYLREVVP